MNLQNPKIILEDNYLLVLNKPTGWIVNSASTTNNQPVIQDWVKNNFDFPISKNDLLRSGMVHRLDKETSGVLIFAKTEKALKKLQKQFKNREIKKTYQVLVHGSMLQNEGEINVPVGRLPWSREKFGVIPGGRKSQTNFKIIKKYKKGSDYFTLAEAYPRTGRTHQIRIHMKYLGHPVVSDAKYAGRKTIKSDQTWCPRQFLHAYKIMFRHPETKMDAKVIASLPTDLKNVLLKLQSA